MATITPEIARRIAPERPYPLTVRALADKWGTIFGVDPSWVVSHAWVESSNRPRAYNARGNAWGLMQLKPGTAADAVRWVKIASRKLGAAEQKEAKKVLSYWHGEPSDLLNPELNLMLGTFYLGHIKRQMEKLFGRGDQAIVAAAYNQGPGAVRKAMRSGDFQPTVAMTHYLSKMDEAKEKGFA